MYIERDERELRKYLRKNRRATVDPTDCPDEPSGYQKCILNDRSSKILSIESRNRRMANAHMLSAVHRR